MLLVGDNSPHDEEVMDMNGRMDPEKTDFVKVRQYQSCQASIVLHLQTTRGTLRLLFGCPSWEIVEASQSTINIVV